MPAPRTPKATVTDASVKIVQAAGPNTGPAVEETYGYDPSEVEAADSTQEIVALTPKDAIPSDTIVYVRNNTRCVVRFVDGAKAEDRTFNLLLAPAGDPDSVASLDRLTVLRNPGFQRWWRAGRLTVTTSQEIESLEPKTDNIEIERLQQTMLEGKLTNERTAKGSLPVTTAVDLSFLDEYKKENPKL